MPTETRKKLGIAARWIALAMLALGLAGCANQSYVVLLANDDGTTGKVFISGRAGSTLLEKDHDGATLGGPAGKTFVVGDDTIARDFSAAMAASPKKPLSFLFYFETARVVLTPESKARIPLLLDEIRQRPAPDIAIVGHTDTVGQESDNVSLGLARARFVAMLFDSMKIGTDRIAIESHGEKNLLVQTPDDTDELLNRRVEVMVR